MIRNPGSNHISTDEYEGNDEDNDEDDHNDDDGKKE